MEKDKCVLVDKEEYEALKIKANSEKEITINMEYVLSTYTCYGSRYINIKTSDRFELSEGLLKRIHDIAWRGLHNQKELDDLNKYLDERIKDVEEKSKIKAREEILKEFCKFPLWKKLWIVVKAKWIDWRYDRDSWDKVIGKKG